MNKQLILSGFVGALVATAGILIVLAIQPTYSPSDVNKDGAIDIYDLSLFLTEYPKQ